MGLFDKGDRGRKLVDRLPRIAFYGGDWYDSAELVGAIWQHVAAKAWEGYLNSGKGHVVLLERSDDIVYVPVAAGLIATSREPLWTSARHHCGRYNPEREVVLGCGGARDEKAFEAEDWVTFCGIVKPPGKNGLTPPQAYQAELNAQARVQRALNTHDQ